MYKISLYILEIVEITLACVDITEITLASLENVVN
jgi:hypothetical protein